MILYNTRIFCPNKSFPCNEVNQLRHALALCFNTSAHLEIGWSTSKVVKVVFTHLDINIRKGMLKF